jgi:malonate transporter MadL subunit
MVIYGVSLLAFSYIVGQFLGEFLGKLLGIDTNIGGVGFAMIILITLNAWFQKKGYLSRPAEQGIQFWNNMYIPIVVAMAATQNVKAAVSGGFIAILAGIIPVAVCFLCIPYVSKLAAKPKVHDRQTH